MPEHAPHPYPNRWWILAALISVILMTPLDGSIVNIIMPEIRADFQVALGQVAWVSLAYLLVITGLILPMARLGDLFGFRRLFLTGVVVFTVSSLLCALAPTLNWLIAARVLQGLGACMMMALSSGIATAIFPGHERGRAMGTVGMGIAVGLTLGPALGGMLTARWGWPSVFLINLPIGLLGGLWCWRMLPALAPVARQRLDWLGSLLAIPALGGLLVALTHGDSWGWTAPTTLGHIGLSLVAGTAFFLVELRHPSPMLDLSLFRNRVFAGGNLATMLNYLGQFSALFLTPVLLLRVHHFDIKQVGMMLAAMPLSLLVLAPLSGTLSDRFGSRVLATAGETIVAVGLVLLAIAAPSSHVHAIVIALVTIGAGSGIFQSPNNSAVMGSVPRTHLGIGGGVLATMRNLGMAMGTAVSSALVVLGTAHSHAVGTAALSDGIRLAYFTGAGFVLLGALASAVRQDHPRTPIPTLPPEGQAPASAPYRHST